ncbi:MAG: hypothetical protein H7144_11720 [Burkholderiales bacterium]|nr:hypothetical protein [Phycisphaerae bacterium]
MRGSIALRARFAPGLVAPALFVLGAMSSFVSAAVYTVPSGTSATFTSADAPLVGTGDSAVVNGQLTVESGDFGPGSLLIDGIGSPDGDVYFNVGQIQPSSITMQNFSRLLVNAPASANSLTNGGTTVSVDSTLTINGSVSNSANFYTTSNGVVTTTSQFQTDGNSTLGGNGSISAGTFTLEGVIAPGDLEATTGTGTLALTSANDISLANTIYLLDIMTGFGPFFESDKLTVNGSITLGNGLLVMNTVSDPTGLLQVGDRFDVIDATAALTLGDTFGNDDPSNFPVDDGSGNQIGYFNVGYDVSAGQVYLTYVPEPASLGVVGLSPLLLVRRRR